MQIAPKAKPAKRSKIASLLIGLISPKQYKGGHDQLRQFRVLLSFELVVIFSCFFVLAVLFLIGSTPKMLEGIATSIEFYTLLVALSTAISYWCGRRGYYNLSSFLLLLILDIAMFATAIFARLISPASTLIFLPLIILVSSIIQKLRFTFLLLAINIIGLAIYTLANMNNLRTIIYQPGLALFIFSGFIILGAYHRNWLETERRRELLQKEARFRALVQNSSDVIVLINEKYELLYVSPSIEEVIGFVPEDVIGKNDFGQTHPEDVLKLQQTFKYAFEHPGETVRVKFRFPHKKTGEWLNLELVGNNQVYENGEKNLFINIRDVTQQHRLEEEIQKAQRLEGLGRLAGGIAHDFNNVLTVISGNLSLARQTQLPLATSELLKEAETAALNARQLSYQLLTFASGGTPVMRSTALAPLLRQAVEFAPGVETHFEIAPDLASVQADPNQLQQVIRNLVANAIQAMPNGGQLRIRAETLKTAHKLPSVLDSDRQYNIITLQDTGEGIAEQNLERIFDPFFSTKAGRSGLGLATAFSIMRQHEGTIEVESQLGNGSLFRIYLPSNSNQSTVQKDLPAPPEIPRAKRILVLEDEVSIQRVLKRLLGQHGFEVEVTQEGNQTLKLYREAMQNGRAYDLIITDLTIKDGLGGKETIQKLREMDPNAKAIIVSGYSKDDTLAHYEKYGFRGAIAKPFRFEELLEVVNRAIA